MSGFKKIMTPARIIAFGFASMILLGSLLLMLPFCIKEGATLSYIDSLYTATSAVCVTGLVTVDTGETFTVAGQIVIMLLIQGGGLGVTAIGTGIILAMGKRLSFRGQSFVKEGMNLDTAKDMVKFIKSVFLTTLAFELSGAVLSFIVFSRDFSPGQALFMSLFHSVAAFNNSGFDVLGNFANNGEFQNLLYYRNDVLLNLVTCALIFFGGIGFLVIREMFSVKFSWKKYSMHTKIVLSVSAALLVAGTLLIKATENVSWLGAVFLSFSARTAGFSTYPMSGISTVGLFTVIILMFIGASPGSTGGGIKTTTFFTLLSGIKSSVTKSSEKAFHYSLPRDAFRKSSVILLIALGVIIGGTYLMLLMDPGLAFIDALFEIVSAFATVGLTTGITPGLSVGSKILSIVVMYCGRLGPMTIAALGSFTHVERVFYPTGNISIG